MSSARLLAVVAVAAAAPFAAKAGTFATLYSFTGGADGAGPSAGLIHENGALYGTTEQGGAANNGTVFAFDPATGAETQLYSFKGGTDGATPQGKLTYNAGMLYGTTINGGTSGSGTVFAVNASTGAETVLYSFETKRNGLAGLHPQGGVIYVAGWLFGTTFDGGATGGGVAYKVDAITGQQKELHAFGASDGANPNGGLVYLRGALYGSAKLGGNKNAGVVFAIDHHTGSETVIYNFSGQADGKYPDSGLTYRGGSLFGTTAQGGAAGLGTVFTVDTTTGAETVLDSLSGKQGVTPVEVTNRGAQMFGTALDGGKFSRLCGHDHGLIGCGTIFKVDTKTQAARVVYRFTGAGDGAHPMGELLFSGGTFYGTTSSNALGYGTVFSLTP